MTPNDRYVIVSPCRDEAAHMRRTLDSVSLQSVPPDLWVVVDDGSTDGTAEILAEYAAQLPYLRVVRRADRGARSVGPGVIEAFHAGYDLVEGDAFGFLCKLDLDLELPTTYFETLLERMRAEPRLGTCSGKPFYVDRSGRQIDEVCSDEMSAGMAKFYRTACYRDIGGFVPQVMWDGIDCHRCRMLGWTARSFDDDSLRFLHLRPMGSSQDSMWVGRRRHGRGQWFMGTGLPFMTLSALFRCTRPPRITGGVAMWLGYVGSMLHGAPRYPDLEFRAFLRRFQSDALWLGKRRALARLERRRAATSPRPAP